MKMFFALRCAVLVEENLKKISAENLIKYKLISGFAFTKH